MQIGSSNNYETKDQTSSNTKQILQTTILNFPDVFDAP